MGNEKKNLSLALSLCAVVLGMVMLAYASVPLYRIFCKATGFGGTSQVADQADHKPTNRAMVVRFDANVAPGLDWSFKPAQLETSLKVGEEKHIEYIARNRGYRTTMGSATFNITPVKAGKYFDKIQCFCFTEQALKSKEQKQLGVTFFIDPAINDDPDLNDVHTITLSYTFFPVNK